MLFLHTALLILCFTLPSSVLATGGFETWLSELRQEALGQGLHQATIDTALGHLTLLPNVLKKQQRQPEKLRTLDQYLRQIASPQRIAIGREKMMRHKLILERISRRYQVQPRFIVALWGVESDFGRNSGQTPVVPALATLAFAGQRSDYFRRELLVALRILDEGHVSFEQMKGSWAGAMGQCQFMPWNFLRRAVDFDGDGRRDIWHSTEDVLASIAHFLSKLGWRDDLTWGREISLPPPPDHGDSLKNGKKGNLLEWQRLGVRRLDGRDLPRRSVQATLIRPSRSGGRAFLAYSNYDVLLKWNRSTSFALAIGQIADRIKP
jgi:membrane-bound lytic murein transglycosylase B